MKNDVKWIFNPLMAILIAIYLEPDLFPGRRQVPERNEQSLRDSTLDNPGGATLLNGRGKKGVLSGFNLKLI